MKTGLFALLLLLIVNSLQAQSYYDTTACFYSVCSAPHVDTVYQICDSINTPAFKIHIDNTPNNSWQFAHSPKFSNPTLLPIV